MGCKDLGAWVERFWFGGFRGGWGGGALGFGFGSTPTNGFELTPIRPAERSFGFELTSTPNLNSYRLEVHRTGSAGYLGV